MTRGKGFDNKAILYVRVSTEEQSSAGVSIENQVARLLSYCQQRGLQVVETVIDAGVSGGKYLSQRPGGRKVLEAIATRKATHVVAAKLDRLFRNAADALWTIEGWDNEGISTHLLDVNGMGLDTSSPMGKLILTMMAGFAQLERHLIKDRTKQALAHKKASGQRYTHSVYGLDFDDNGKATVNSNERTTIQTIFQLRKAGKSLRAIANHLIEIGAKTKRGGKWAAATVKKILENSLNAYYA
jgi:site-specific DNA recombinase